MALRKRKPPKRSSKKKAKKPLSAGIDIGKIIKGNRLPRRGRNPQTGR